MPILTDNPIDAEEVKIAIRKTLELWIVDKTTQVDPTTGIFTFRAPYTPTRFILTRAQAFVETAGVTNPTTIQIRNLTRYPSNDALSTAVSIASGSRVGTPGVINTLYYDFYTDDEIKIYVTANSTTKALGLLVSVEFGILQ